MKNTLSLFFFVIMLVLSGCASPLPLATVNTSAPAAQMEDVATVGLPEVGLRDGCVERYLPDEDYFPQKIQPEYAEGWTVEYHNNYKVLTLLNPWAGAEQIFQYVLVQCGTPAPEGYEADQILEVPVQRVAALTSTQLPHLNMLRLLDRLVAVDEFDYINTPAVREKIDAGVLQETGEGAGVDVELLIDLAPDLVFTFAYGDLNYDAHPKLLEAGLPVVLNAGYMETSPLGRSEWLKVTSLFFNQEAVANEVFADIVAQYKAMVALAGEVEERPTVLAGIVRGDSWRVSGGNSYLAQYIADAGGDYLWSADESTGSMPLAFETGYDVAIDADYWLPNTGSWFTLADVIAADERYAELAAVRNKTVYNNNANLNPWGGNDYWETGVANPHLVLADLIAIFHPDLLPDHDLIWFHQLQ